jgi:FkbM family methyltransferase
MGAAPGADRRPTVAESLRWIPKEGGSFVEIGANIGLYAETVLKERPDPRAGSSSPSASTTRAAARASAASPGSSSRTWRSPRVRAHDDLEVEAQPGRQRRRQEIVDQRKTFMHFRPERIRMAKFDDYAQEHGIRNVDFVKSDTDGYDARALKGMLGFLSRCDPKPVILVELMNEGMHPDWPGQVEVLEALYRARVRAPRPLGHGGRPGRRPRPSRPPSGRLRIRCSNRSESASGTSSSATPRRSRRARS